MRRRRRRCSRRRRSRRRRCPPPRRPRTTAASSGSADDDAADMRREERRHAGRRRGGRGPRGDERQRGGRRRRGERGAGERRHRGDRRKRSGDRGWWARGRRCSRTADWRGARGDPDDDAGGAERAPPRQKLARAPPTSWGIASDAGSAAHPPLAVSLSSGRRGAARDVAGGGSARSGSAPRRRAPPTAAFAVTDEEVTLRLGDRRWRVRGLAKNTRLDALKVNVLVTREGARAFTSMRWTCTRRDSARRT